MIRRTRRRMPLLLALAISPFAVVSASACKACMEMSQYDSDPVPVPLPSHIPADIESAPRLSAEDVAYLTGLEDGKRYARVGKHIADKSIRDIWTRLLSASDLDDLLRPRAAAQCAGLRERARKKRLSAKDRALAAHLSTELAGATAADDAFFLMNQLKPKENP